ncbi:MAG: nitroreductase family protein [Actinomycetota bacterium]|nr:nitroreductase family protein [Actinomycetota bacterium]
MDFKEVITSAATSRDFQEIDVPDTTVFEILDIARFAPSGGNRQGWHVVLFKDKEVRSHLKDLYVSAWSEYMGYVSLGEVPFLREAEGDVKLQEAMKVHYPLPFADNLDSHPVLLGVFVDLNQLAVTDGNIGRQSIVGGASIYPFCHNILLAARSMGLGGVITTVLARKESEVRRLVNLPTNYAMAALMALGVPKKRPQRLKRKSVSDFTTVDAFDGPRFSLEPDVTTF